MKTTYFLKVQIFYVLDGQRVCLEVIFLEKMFYSIKLYGLRENSVFSKDETEDL